MEGGVFKIGDKYFAFSHDMLLCELLDPIETKQGGVEATQMTPSNLTLNEFIQGCLGASKEELDNIDFIFSDGITEC